MRYLIPDGLYCTKTANYKNYILIPFIQFTLTLIPVRTRKWTWLTYCFKPSPKQQMKKSLRDESQEKVTDGHEKLISNSRRMMLGHSKQSVPVDTRYRFNVDTTSHRRWNEIVCLRGALGVGKVCVNKKHNQNTVNIFGFTNCSSLKKGLNQQINLRDFPGYFFLQKHFYELRIFSPSQDIVLNELLSPFLAHVSSRLAYIYSICWGTKKIT